MVRVKVSEGFLEGETVKDEYAGTFYSFKGVPYAQPPVGNLRFKAPLPPKSWEGVRSAKKFGSQSYQKDLMTGIGVLGSEDSLYLNIYTPSIEPKKPLPVMFWIHGGAFICGSGDDDFFGPEYLLKQGVIVVTINYRLEVLGFLCLNTADVPGNAGMKDQVEALRWVSKNISNFGGNPRNITIFGESAGGASVSYLLVSPMSKGLLQRAIVQSGASLCPWALNSKPRERALTLARQLGCYSENDKELYEFFMKQPLESLVGTSVPILLSEKVNKSMFSFSVVEEQQVGNNDRFFAEGFNTIHEDVEIMIGSTTDEGLVFLTADTIQLNLEMAREFPENFVPKSLVFDLTINQQYELGKKMRKYYFGSTIDVSGDWQKLAKFYSTNLFIHGIHRFTKLCLKSNKAYSYKFSCKTERNLFSDIMGLKDIVKSGTVTCHADDLFYIFKAKLISNNINSNTLKLMEKVVTLWTNFAKFGNPTPDGSLGVKWQPYTHDSKHYLDIGNEFVARTDPDSEEVNFWDGIYEEYGQKLI